METIGEGVQLNKLKRQFHLKSSPPIRLIDVAGRSFIFGGVLKVVIDAFEFVNFACDGGLIIFIKDVHGAVVQEEDVIEHFNHEHEA